MYVVIVYLILVAANALWWWRADRLLLPLPKPHAAMSRLIFGAFVALQLATLSVVLLNYSTAYLTGTSTSEWPIPAFIAALAYIWHLMLLPAVLVLWLIAAIVRLVTVSVRWLKARIAHQSTGEGVVDASQSDEVPATTLSTRRLVLTSLVAAPPLAALLITGSALPRAARYRLNRMTVVLPQLPPALEGLTIAHLSDTHIGYFTDEVLIRNIIEDVNALNVDLIAVTGDLVNRSLKDLPIAAEMIGALRSRHGMFICEGNHDLIQDPERFRRESLAAGLPLLVNDSATLQINSVPLQILSLRWGSGRQDGHPALQHGDTAIEHSMRQLLDQRDQGAFPILLAHHPHAFDAAAAAGIPLTLAGHTHGGQMHLSDRVGFGPWIFRYWSGQYCLADSVCVVSNGTGNWFPVRVNAPAELIHLTLRREIGVG